MADLFEDKAEDWDTRPLPLQISEGVFDALSQSVELSPELTVMDFGAGTGLVCGKLAPKVGKILAVDVSQAMLDKLAAKEELKGKVEVICQDILDTPLDREIDLVVSAMAMHHVEDTRALLQTLFDHLAPGGRIALADLDEEEGDFHPPDIEGVYHAGFDRDALAALLEEVGFSEPQFVTATEVTKEIEETGEKKSYPIFLVTATKPA